MGAHAAVARACAPLALLAALACGRDGEVAAEPARAAPAPVPVPEGSSSDAPAPQQPVAGLRGFRVRSLVTYGGHSTRYRLENVFHFPERLFFSLGPEDDPRQLRTMQFRFGGDAYQIDAGETRSRELGSDERDRFLRRADLRLAAFLWPEAFAWSSGGDERTASLGGGGTLGDLRAELAPGADRPRRIEVVDAGGRAQEALTIDSWQELAGRSWPARMRFWYRDADGRDVLAWTETVEDVETRVGFVDEYFLPPDRR